MSILARQKLSGGFMRYLIFGVLFLSVFYTYSQVTGGEIYYFDQVRSTLLLDSYGNKLSGSMNGAYLFDTWSNKGRVFQNNKIYVLDQLNYNIQKDRFEVKFEQDSIFVLSSPEDAVVEIGKRKFKRFIDPETKRSNYFEVVANVRGDALLIGYSIKIEKALINPLTKVPEGPDKLTKKESYYYTDDSESELLKLKLNKKTVLGLIEKEKQPLVQKHIKTYELKYNNISDVVKIFEYYHTI